MTSLALAFDILARDKGASQTFQKVGKAADETGRRGEALSGKMKFAAGAIAGAFAGIQIGGFLKGAIAEAREAAKVTRLTENVIRATGGAAKLTAAQVGSLSEALSNKTGIDDEVVQSSANLLLTFKQIRNETGKGNNVFDRAAAAALDLSVQFGGVDAASKGLGKALNDPLKGIGALSKAGVTFTQQQKDQIKTLVKSGNVLGAQKIILSEIEGQVGGAAAAAADPMQKLGVIVGNLKERIGTAFLPVVEKAASFLGTALPAAFGAVSRAIEPFIAGLVRGEGPISGFAGFLNTLGLAIRAMFLAFQDGDVTSNGLVGTFERIGVFAKTKLIPALTLLRDFFRKQVIPALSAVGSFVRSNVLPVLSALAGFIITKVVPAAQRIAGILLGALRDGLAKVSQKIQENRPQLEALGQVLLKVAGFIVSRVLPIVARLAGYVAKNLFSSISTGITIISRLVSVVQSLVGFFQSAIEKARSFGTAIKNLPGTGLLGKIPGFASGGMLQPGWNTVGERGPELLYNAGTKARVFSNSDSQRMTSGSSVTFAPTIYGHDTFIADSLRAERDALMFHMAT